jgi:hypothetical protein
MKLISYCVAFFYSAFLLGTASCQSKLDKNIAYLSVDSIYRTPEEKIKYNELKIAFLKNWFDSTNCYVKDYFKKPKYAWESVNDVRKILKVEVDNIIHAKNFDSVIVFVTYYAANIDDNGKKEREITISDVMKAVISLDGKWHFDCKKNNLGAYVDGENFEASSILLKNMIINSGYLKYGKPDPNYVHNFFDESVTFPKSTEPEIPATGPVK